jgi:hypothetical protein
MSTKEGRKVALTGSPLDGLVVRLTQAEEELVGLSTRAEVRVDADPVVFDDRAAVRACLSRMLRLVDGVAT